MALFSGKRVAVATALACLVALAPVVVQSQTTHFSGDEVQVAWQIFTNAVGKGNGAFLSPRGDALVVVSSNGVVRALNPEDGVALWSFPSTPGATSSSGAFFNTNADTPYVAYCVTSGGAARYVLSRRNGECVLLVPNFGSLLVTFGLLL
jgi:outer membrane protein assembly factor BamB